MFSFLTFISVFVILHGYKWDELREELFSLGLQNLTFIKMACKNEWKSFLVLWDINSSCCFNFLSWQAQTHFSLTQPSVLSTVTVLIFWLRSWLIVISLTSWKPEPMHVIFICLENKLLKWCVDLPRLVAFSIFFLK